MSSYDGIKRILFVDSFLCHCLFFWTVSKEKYAILHVHTRQAISVGTSTDDISHSCFYRQCFRKGILMTGHQSCVIVGKPLVSEAFFYLEKQTEFFFIEFMESSLLLSV